MMNVLQELKDRFKLISVIAVPDLERRLWIVDCEISAGINIRGQSNAFSIAADMVEQTLKRLELGSIPTGQAKFSIKEHSTNYSKLLQEIKSMTGAKYVSCWTEPSNDGVSSKDTLTYFVDCEFGVTKSDREMISSTVSYMDAAQQIVQNRKDKTK